MRALLILTLLLSMPTAQASLFGKNKADDSFAIKSVAGSQAVTQGNPKDLKAGDILYSNKSPFKFTVSEVKGSTVTVALPERHELKVGMALLRMPTDPIKKAIDTEERLKRALED